MSNKLDINPSSNNKLELEIGEQSINGLLDFDGSTYVLLESEPDITGDKTIFFNLYLDSDDISTNLAAIVSFSHVVDRTDQFMVYTYNDVAPNRIYIVPSSDSAEAKWIATTGLGGDRLQWEISKSAGEINYLKINGVEKTLSAFDGGFMQPDVPGIGRRKLEGTNINAFADGLIWDVEIKDGSTGSGTSLYKWRGYPNGDQNSAWTDQSGTVDGSVSTIDGNIASTRNLSAAGSSSKLLLQGTTIETPLLTFTTDGSEFDPIVGIVGGGTLEWDMGDGSIINSNSFSHIFSSEEGDKIVKMYAGTTSGVEAIDFINIPEDRIKGSYDFSDFTSCRSIVMNNQPITGITVPSSSPDPFNLIFNDCSIAPTFDFSNLSNFRGSLNLSKNPGLQSVLVPDSSENISNFYIEYCDLIGTLDISSLTGLGGSIRLNNNPNLKKILNPITSGNAGNLSGYNARNCDITGVLDLTGFGSKFGGSIILDSNPNMTQVLFPSSSVNVNQIYLYLGFSDPSGLIGTLDVSGLTNLGGMFRTDNNKTLTQILFPTTTRNFSQMILYRCDLTGTLDMSGLSGLGGLVLMYDNPNLTEVKFPTSSNSISSFSIAQCDITGTLDVSGLTNISGTINIGDNPNLTEVLLPNTSGNVGTFSATDTSLSTVDLSGLSGLHTIYIRNITNMQSITWMAVDRGFNVVRADDASLNLNTVDNLFSIMNTWYTSNTPTSSLELTIDGGTNSPPTDGSSNSDILNLESIFSGAGQTLIININT